MSRSNKFEKIYYTNRESASVDAYLNRIGKFKLLTVDEEVDLAQKIKKGDRNALEKLINSNLRFVVTVAKTFQNQGLSLPDLINEGNIGLIKAAEKFDETRGFKFISYAVRRIKQTIEKAIAEQSRIVRLSLNVTKDINKIYKAICKNEQKYGRDPTNEELAQILEMDIEKIEKARNADKKSSSLDTTIDTDNGQISLYENITDTSLPEPDYELRKESLKKNMVTVLNTLTPREKNILEMIYGINHSHAYSLEEVGEVFGLTRERVRQIKERAIRRMRHTSRAKLLKQYLG